MLRLSPWGLGASDMAHRFSGALIGIGALLLACGAAQVAAEESVITLETQFMTERGAQIALTKIVGAIDAAVPALTPEQQAYVNREEAFRNGPGDVGIGGTLGNRVSAYIASRELSLWVAHQELERLRNDLAGVKSLAGRPERFALWSDIVVQMSHPGPLENSLNKLRGVGLVDKNSLGVAQGVTWLSGSREGEVQIVWPFWAETMWASWCYEGIADATGASKVLKLKRPQ
jgi:hypothetical protein